MSLNMNATSIVKMALLAALASAVLLLVPWVAMHFTTEMRWELSDFATAGVLFFLAALVCLLGTARLRSARQKLALVGAVVVALAVVWLELSVGIFH